MELDKVILIIKFYKDLVNRKDNEPVEPIINNLIKSAQDSLKNIHIVCTSELEYEEFSNIADDLGFRWKTGDKYTELNNYDSHKHIKCFSYDLSDCTYGKGYDISDDTIGNIKSVRWFVENYKLIVDTINLDINKQMKYIITL